jgi:hypothetical protein
MALRLAAGAILSALDQPDGAHASGRVERCASAARAGYAQTWLAVTVIKL